MKNGLIHEVVHMDSLIHASYGMEDGLPQIETTEDIINEMVSNCTGKTINLVNLELHGLVDPSYEAQSFYRMK